MTLTHLRSEVGDVVLVGTVPGLVSETELVRRAIGRTVPRLVALGLSPEGAESLLQFEGDPDIAMTDEMADHDIMYSEYLGRYGAVALPPPDMLHAARQARERGWGLHGVDMPEEVYEEAFTKTVSTWGFLNIGRIQRKLAKRPPKAIDAREFALRWDAAMRRVKGVDTMEKLRERTMAHNARDLLAREGGPMLFIVELAREAGVRAELVAAGFREI